MKIPEKNRQEWRLLLTDELDVSLKNFFFQMKVTQAKNQINNGRVSIEDAIDEIYELVLKFQKAKHMPEDIERIFGQSNSNFSKDDNLITDENIFEVIEESVKKEENEAFLAKEKQKKEILKKIKLQEEKAKIELQKEKSLESEKLRLEAQKTIERRLEEERLIRKQKEIARLKQKEQDVKKSKLREEQELIRIKNANQRKKRTAPKKKSFWGFIFGK